MVKKEGKEVFYDCRYFDNRLPGKDRCVKTGHQTLGQAQMFAIEKSDQFGYCGIAEVQSYMIGEVPQEDIIRRWGYLAGHEVDISKEVEAEKEQAIARAHKKLQKLETEEQIAAAKRGATVTSTKENDMSDVTSTEIAKATKGKVVIKVTPAAAKNAGKGANAAAAKAQKAGAKGKAKAPAKAPKAKKEAVAPLGKPGSLLASFGARAGSNRGNMLQLLCDNVGKLLPIKDVLKATYGTTNLEKISPLRMVIKGAEEMIKLNKIDAHIARGEDAKGDTTLGLKKGKAKD